jgi:hypothetical protein
MLQTIRRTSARSGDLRKQEDCPICQKSMSLRGLKKHIASHQQQLALFALPPNVDETEAEEHEDNKRSAITTESDEESLGVAEEASRASTGHSDYIDLAVSNPPSPQDSLGMAENDNTSQLASESLNETEGEERLPLSARSSSDYLRRRWSPPPIIMRNYKPEIIQNVDDEDCASDSSTDDGDVSESNEPLTGVSPRPFHEGKSKDLQPSWYNDRPRSPLSSDGSLRTNLEVEGVPSVSGHEMRLHVDGTLPLDRHLSRKIEEHTPQLVPATLEKGKMIATKQQSQLSSETLPNKIQPTYAKIHQKHLEIDTLHYYDIPYEFDSDPDYLIVLRELDHREIDIMFEHTRRLRSGKYPELFPRKEIESKKYSTEERSEATMTTQNAKTE